MMLEDLKKGVLRPDVRLQIKVYCDIYDQRVMKEKCYRDFINQSWL